MLRYLKRHHITLVLVLVMVMSSGISTFAAAADEVESNNRIETANRIKIGTVIYGVTDDYDFYGNETGFDWFRFTAPVSGTANVTIKADYLPYRFTSAELNVYDSSGRNKITRAYDDKSAYGGKTVQFGVTAGRTYYIRVCCDYAGYCSEGAEYHFKVSYAVGKTSITSKKAAKKAFTVKWNKKAGTSYYQVQYTAKNTWKGAKTVNTKANSLTAKKLAKNKKYYVRVRVVRKISGVTYCSGWSKVQTIRTK